jgi:hypothetical protein
MKNIFYTSSENVDNEIKSIMPNIITSEVHMEYSTKIDHKIDHLKQVLMNLEKTNNTQDIFSNCSRVRGEINSTKKTGKSQIRVMILLFYF